MRQVGVVSVVQGAEERVKLVVGSVDLVVVMVVVGMVVVRMVVKARVMEAG